VLKREDRKISCAENGKNLNRI